MSNFFLSEVAEVWDGESLPVLDSRGCLGTE